MDKLSKKVDVIAPVLRMIYSENGKCPIIRFSQFDKTEKVAQHQIKVDLGEDFTDDHVIDVLRKTRQQQSGNIAGIAVEGLGVFDIIPLPDKVEGNVASKVAIVTGAAQGFGLGIAESLVQQGANVILADINDSEAEKQANILRNKYGNDRAISVCLDVTNYDSVENAIHSVVSFYGGFDILISNAGVLKAGSVRAMDEKDFDFVTSVNYKGFFLCVKAASKILALQHKVHSEYLSDIIQINSKSGLAGSNRNGAYAGSKFGSIGLTQSFAMELIEEGIKVNCVCPGNFFDGSLWSNPENGLFVQYLKSGKVPGAKTIQDVKSFYESKVPLKRGCNTDDVMKAVYYIIDQKYETGQAMPVTGGQIMLH